MSLLTHIFAFADEAAPLHGQELIGLVNGVKGKLFELKHVDFLNSGELPNGYWLSIGTCYLAAKGKAGRELCLEMERQIHRNEVILGHQ